MSIEKELGRIADALEKVIALTTNATDEPQTETVAVQEKPARVRKSRAKAKTEAPAEPPVVEDAEFLKKLGQKIAQTLVEDKLVAFSTYVKDEICGTFMVSKLSQIPQSQVAQGKKKMLAKAKELGYAE